MSEQPPRPSIDPELVAKLKSQAESYIPEVRQLLPQLPEDLRVSINNKVLIKSTGTGGYPVAEDEIAVAFDPDFDGDKEQQQVNFRGSVFHEAYHVAQGFVGEDSRFKGSPFIENAILEGAATKFEMIRAGTKPGWSEYPEDEIDEWFNEVLGMEYTPDGETWGRIKFYDPETKRRWVLYRVGCYVIDNALTNSDLEIEDLVNMEPKEILKLSKLTGQSKGSEQQPAT